MSRYRITVCTPTYNRAYIIENLYRSLQMQTFRDFEWLLIDDGSADHTKELFDTWCRTESRFTIRYVRKENGGKHTAVNEGLRIAKGEIFFVVDSDDVLTADALEKIDHWFREIEGQPAIKGVTANKGTTAQHTPNTYFSERYLDKTLLEMESYTENGKRVISGERAMAFYTDFHRAYYYPVFTGERFMTEAVAYNRMAHDGYQMRFYNDIICVYEYKEDGLTRAGNELFLKNPRGYSLWLREKSDFLGGGFPGRLRVCYSLVCELSGRYSPAEIAACVGIPRSLTALLLLLHRLKRLGTAKNSH